MKIEDINVRKRRQMREKKKTDKVLINLKNNLGLKHIIIKEAEKD